MKIEVEVASNEKRADIVVNGVNTGYYFEINKRDRYFSLCLSCDDTCEEKNYITHVFVPRGE